MSGIINQVIRSNTHFYPAAKQMLVSQLKAGTSMNVDDGRAVFAMQAINTAWQLAKDEWGFTAPKVTALWKPCAILSCGGADACFADDKGQISDNMSVVPSQIKLFTSGFTEFWGNYVSQRINGTDDPEGFEFFPQSNPSVRGINNEGHVASFLWDLWKGDGGNAGGWAGDDIYTQGSGDVFRTILQENYNTINNVQDFYNKWVAMINAGRMWGNVDMQSVNELWQSNFTRGFPRTVYDEDFDCEDGRDCGGLDHPTSVFWDIRAMGKYDVGAGAPGYRNMVMRTEYVEWPYYGHANTPWLNSPGITRNSPGGLLFDYEAKYGSSLYWVWTAASLMQGVNATWPAVSFIFNPSYYTSDPPGLMRIETKDYEGRVLASAQTTLDPGLVQNRTVIIRARLNPTYTGTTGMPRNRITFQVLDKATNALLGETSLNDANLHTFTFVRFEHEMPDEHIEFDNIRLIQQ